MSKKEIYVKKRNGKSEKLSVEKINKVLQWAVDGIKDVSFEEVAMNAHLTFFDGIESKAVHTLLIEAAAGLISEEKPNYQFVAGRLVNYQLRKEVWGGKDAPKLLHVIKDNIKHGVYDPQILEWYSEFEINKINEYIKHERDFDFAYAGIRQLCDKYLLQNRFTGKIFETPQFMYALIAMTLFRSYGDNRMEYVKKAYNYFSKHKINLPTPVMAGVRSNLKSYASCALFAIDDTLPSIFANNSAIGFATADRYGIGLNVSRIRAINAPVKNGTLTHTGVVPYLKMYESTVKSCQQNGIRGGGGTVNISWFHHDIQEVMVLKDNSGTDDNRVRKLDYVVGIDRLFLERFLNNQDVTLFSYHEVPELWNNFGLPSFKDLYEKAEKNKGIKFKKKVAARDLMNLLAKQRSETTRIYTMAVDHANEHGTWNLQVDTSNLCLEIHHPLIPIQDVKDPNGEIGVCVLAAVNWLEIKDDNDMKSVCDVIVRMLDALIDHQQYKLPAMENFAKKRRSLGVGITNVAALLAKEGVKYYDPEAPNLVAKWMEKTSYYLIDASAELAKEVGKCEKWMDSKFSQGILPIDTYCKNVDEFVTEPLHCDWESLRKKLLETGVRNSTLTAIMPAESSSVVQSSTNGIEPVRQLISGKTSKGGTLPVVVPGIDKWKKNYTLAFEMPSNEGLLKVVAAAQKFTDMSISTNTYHVPGRHKDNKTPLSEIIHTILLSYKYGIKNLYYANTDDGDRQTASETKHKDIQKPNRGDSCESGACAI